MKTKYEVAVPLQSVFNFPIKQERKLRPRNGIDYQVMVMIELGLELRNLRFGFIVFLSLH